MRHRFPVAAVPLLALVLSSAPVPVAHAETTTINLAPQWSLVSTPLEPEVTAIATVLQGICFKSAWEWQQGTWGLLLAEGSEATSAYAASKGFGLFTDLHAGQGFWLRGCGTAAAELTIQGNPVADTAPSYQPGWNLVGLKTAQSKAVSEVLTQEVVSVWSWNEALAHWRVYLPAGLEAYVAEKGYEALASIGATDGFWVNAAVNLGEPPTPPTLEPVTSCDTLLDGFKSEAIKRMEEQVDKYRDSYLTFGCSSYAIWWYPTAYTDGAVGASPPSSEGASSAATSYSETNVQVAGVDEADFVKNDGKYITMLAAGKLRIVDAWPPEQAHEIASLAVKGTPMQMFVANGKAFIYSTLIAEKQPPVPGASASMPILWNGSYGYDSVSQLKITIVDLATITTPTVLREMTINGTYLNSRRIGNAVHTAATFPTPAISGLLYWPEALNSCYQWYGYGYNAWQDGNTPKPEFTKEEVIALFEAVKAQNKATILAADISQWLPTVTDTQYSGGQSKKETKVIGQCTDYYKAPLAGDSNSTFLGLVSTALDGSGGVNGTTIIGEPGTVYASTNALYVASSQWRPWGQPWFFTAETGIEQATLIHKFALDNEQIATTYHGSGVVKGSLANQFHLDEYNGALRVATGISWGEAKGNTVSVLQEEKGKLVLVGQVDGIAPGEDIRSVRFDGDRGFVVTFKKTDPLFALDLSNPAAPTITGELKIPGFSTYIHPLGSKHLLTIGYDAEEMGSFAWFQGIMLQIFDVSSMSSPTLLHKEIIGTRGTTSDATTDHHAFNYFAPKGVLALPMAVCQGGSYGTYGSTMTFNGLMVYDVSTDTGFSHRGDIAHPFPPEYQTTWDGNCDFWWLSPNALVKRSVFMDDYVFSITNDTIKAASLKALGTDLSVITWAGAN